MDENVKTMEIWEMRDLLGLRRLSNGSYRGVFTTGEFDALHDYDVGLLSVYFSTSKGMNGMFGVLMSLGTIDDGNWQAFSSEQFKTSEEAQVIVEQVAQAFIAFMGRSTKLTTENALNNFLMHHKMWGDYTG